MPTTNLPEYGDAIEWGAITLGKKKNGDLIVEDRKRPDDLVEQLHAHAAKKLPPNTRYEIRQAYASNYGRTHGMEWYRTPAMDGVPEWGQGNTDDNRPVPTEEGGYFLVGQYVTPV